MARTLTCRQERAGSNPASGSKRRAQLVADAVAVLCPYCAEAQPNREDGSEQWTAENFKRLPALWKCVSCGAQFIVASESKVMFQ